MRRRSQEIARRSAQQSGAMDASSCVAEIMGTELFTLTPDTVVGSALRLASTKRIRHFLVIEEGSLTGIVCQDDLRVARQGTLVGECMTSPVLCIGPETTLREALDIMAENSVGCLPVVTGTFLVGVVTKDRLARIGLRAAPALAEEEADEPEVCSSCGGANLVRREPRVALMPLCADCAAAIPTPECPRGN
jgi:CBS domain-containing protein